MHADISNCVHKIIIYDSYRQDLSNAVHTKMMVTVAQRPRTVDSVGTHHSGTGTVYSICIVLLTLNG